VLDDSRPRFYRWFDGARFNTCRTALDRHAERDSADRRVGCGGAEQARQGVGESANLPVPIACILRYLDV
jgi:hypothetical protein